MTKKLSISFILLYLMLSTGVQIMIHTCGDSKSISMIPLSTKSPCGCDDTNSENSCCKTEFKLFKLKDTQNRPALVQTENYLTEQTCISVVDQPLSVQHVSTIHIELKYSPPSTTSTNILNCTFLI
jgi:hypothetical protein